jgi:peptide chain release factor subunit 1
MALKEQLRSLVDVPSTNLPFVSVYVDLSPELDAGIRRSGGGSADAPARSWRRSEEADTGHVRPGIRRVRDLLAEEDALLPARGPERESFDRDRERILGFLDSGGYDPSDQGVALFACSGEGFWEAVDLSVPVANRVVIDSTPFLYPLARLDDDYERILLVIADSQTARGFLIAQGRVLSSEVAPGPSRQINYKMTGGLNQKRIQRRIENWVSDHVRDVARRIEEVVTAEKVDRIIVGGGVIARAELEKQLSPQVRDKVVTFDRLDIRLPENVAIARAIEAAREAEKEEDQDIARSAIEATRAGELGAAGEYSVTRALEQGAVDTLVLGSDFSTPRHREELTTLALQTQARVEFVEGSDLLKRAGGVAALLRWNPETATSGSLAQ